MNHHAANLKKLRKQFIVDLKVEQCRLIRKMRQTKRDSRHLADSIVMQSFVFAHHFPARWICDKSSRVGRSRNVIERSPELDSNTNIDNAAGLITVINTHTDSCHAIWNQNISEQLIMVNFVRNYAGLAFSRLTWLFVPATYTLHFIDKVKWRGIVESITHQILIFDWNPKAAIRQEGKFRIKAQSTAAERELRVCELIISMRAFSRAKSKVRPPAHASVSFTWVFTWRSEVDSWKRTLQITFIPNRTTC